jgi:hypothetical protein
MKCGSKNPHGSLLISRIFWGKFPLKNALDAVVEWLVKRE